MQQPQPRHTRTNPLVPYTTLYRSEHIHGDEARQQGLQETIADAQPRLEQRRKEDGVRQDALRDAEAALADWQQRQDMHAREQAEAARAGDRKSTRLNSSH